MNAKRKISAIIVFITFTVLLTRGFTVSHNMYLHCDEHVFFEAAQSLKGYIFGSSPFYEEVKEYPEGAIVLQLPFHVITAIINRLASANISPRLSGRIAAVFYFTCAVILGCIVLHRFFSKRPSTLIFYGLITLFSIMHIEQSRYGTGDAISFFLLMLLILLTATGLSAEKKSLFWIYLAFFVSGALSAVKYPLIFFCIIPIYAFAHVSHDLAQKRKPVCILIAMIMLYMGFAVLSPKAAFDPMYIIRASTRELGAYMGTNSARFSLLFTNILCVVTYSMFYSGFPFMPVLFGISARQRWKNDSSTDKTAFLFCRVLPILIIIFFIYNLLVSFLAMRSFYPFFFLTDLYIAILIDEWYNSKTWKRFIAIVLTALMSVRGAYLILIMTEKDDSTRMAKMIMSAVDDNWSNTRILSGQVIFADGYYDYINLEVVDISDDRFSNSESMKLEHGELFISGARSFPLGDFHFIFSSSSYSLDTKLSRWFEFEETNATFFVGRLYPDYYYYLFGSWIYGTTGNGAEFPNCAIFYRS